MEFKTIHRNTTPIMIVEQFLKSLESGQLVQGQQLPPERELARMFGVGRSSVREAIGILVVMGYLEVLQGKGTFIRRSSAGTNYKAIPLENLISLLPLFDLLEAREILELKAVQLAAERANDQDLAKMRRTIRKLEESGGDTEKFYTADGEFHAAIADATDNAMICHILKSLVRQIHRFNVKFMFTSEEAMQQTITTAKAITSFIAQGEGDRAQNWMYRHLNEVDGSLKNMVAERKKRGERLSLSLWAEEIETPSQRP
ncbi:GntR bacterial regulatory protein HTH signature [Acididesulfobacillus acetoxydans]|uniref:GntR bacterial regulatory protein HTH signature n=1 Tax=Acididesulfobacillus acetoxydans TaxID=1561005 RepID=A0A8S0WFE2_9FIRM|nr:FadR/GntR family transcriptional regulator [Acididesulfobacillus acetoxydans]CAA7600962.1 GntR bacterial regulatory protein HTH signature [Acididesulfobacillus acetoxydans]CEJ07685.1 GntR bacterial regulatory protein HTH signature [Acididesulfobacillus acetoxydans]